MTAPTRVYKENVPPRPLSGPKRGVRVVSPQRCRCSRQCRISMKSQSLRATMRVHVGLPIMHWPAGGSST